jgi:hypothetical protein
MSAPADSGKVEWLKRHVDPYSLKVAIRAAIVMPVVFGFADGVIGDPNTTLFSAFGSFGVLVLTDFGGPWRTCSACSGRASTSTGCGDSVPSWSSPRASSSAPQLSSQEIEDSPPGVLGLGRELLLLAVEERMRRAGIDVDLVLDSGRLER